MVDADPILATVPRPLAPWNEDEQGRVVLERPKPTTSGLKGIADLISWWLSPRKVRLDALGTAVWKRVDGRTTVAELAAAIESEHEAENAADRAALFVRLLYREGYIQLFAAPPPGVEPD